MLSKAIRIASVAFEGTYDKGGKPYILHCLYVMNKVRHLGETNMIAGVLHDLVEDTHWTISMLRDEGFDEDVLSAIDLLTHRKGVPYMDYIKAISINPISTAVKIEDLKHNSNIMRMKGLRKKDFDRLEKYHIAYEYLDGIFG